MAEKKKRDPNVHKGHRERVRKKYLKVGFDGFSDHEVLEFLLYYCNAQQDTNEVAHRLINELGTLGAVFEAPIEELVKVKGVGEQTAFLIRFISDLMKSQMSNFDNREFLNTTERLGSYIVPFFQGINVETTFVLALDDKKRLIRLIKVAEGSFDAVSICIPKIIRQLISCGAVGVVVFHNHPLGAALPSVKDIKVTRQLQLALDSVGVELVDHIIFSNRDNDFISMSDSGERLYTIASNM
ncbi:MAG: JAB domain-containing protein [Oscillospiraceae bacterium]|nr:JAB domain-containing protein [Oscillospiraceae bacterium]